MKGIRSMYVDFGEYEAAATTAERCGAPRTAFMRESMLGRADRLRLVADVMGPSASALALMQVAELAALRQLLEAVKD